MPLVDYFRLEDQFNRLGQFCIATLDKSRSILFYSKVPIEELSGATIGIIPDTSTSIKLLQALFKERFNVKPDKYVGLKDENDAFLLIGDEALRRRYGRARLPLPLRPRRGMVQVAQDALRVRRVGRLQGNAGKEGQLSGKTCSTPAWTRALSTCTSSPRRGKTCA